MLPKDTSVCNFLAVAIVFCVPVKICTAGSLSVDKIKTDIGGGECIDSEDCNNFGICKILPMKKGNCCCVFGYSGRHCGVKSKQAVGPVLAANNNNETTRRQASTNGGKRTSVVTSDLRRKLEYEPSSNIFGLTPNALAEADQPFVIYNPERKAYVFVSHDLREIEQTDPYVEARNDKFGSRNIFKFVKVAGTRNKFYIHNLDQNKYLYVSQSKKGVIKYWNLNLLADSKISSDAKEKESYIFEFDDEDGDGLFTIRNKDKILYVSNHMVGNPPSNLVKLGDANELDRLDSKYFQFALKDKVSSIEFKVTGKKTPLFAPVTVIDGTQTRKVCYKGITGDVETQATNIEFVEDLIDLREYTKAEGFLFNTATTEFKDLYGTEVFTHSSSETETIVKSISRSVIVNIKVNKCACAKITFKNMLYNQPYEFQVKSKENKLLRSKGFIKGESNFDFQVHTEMFDYREYFKCPNEP